MSDLRRFPEVRAPIMHPTTEVAPKVWLILHHTELITKDLRVYIIYTRMALKFMTDTMGRMHSDAQFAGSSSVPAHVEMMGFLGMGNNPMVGATVAIAVAIQQAMN